MSCTKGYRGDCCCECKYQLEISVCACGHCSIVEGYICTVFHAVDHTYKCKHSTNKHGMCEEFSKRKD